MLKEAQSNAGELAKCIAWKTGDAQALDVESNSCDVIVEMLHGICRARTLHTENGSVS